MIHTIPQRLWYVENYLIPSMTNQGISKYDILIFNDSNKRGNLQAFLDSLDYIYNNLQDEYGVWHLQDDVIISSEFAKYTCVDPSIVVNGFASSIMNPEKIGKVNVKDFWYSFPCIYIPNRYIPPFMYFMEEVANNRNDHPLKIRYNKNRYDDYFFYKFLQKVYPKDFICNQKPNLVDHIDYLIGGSTGIRKNQIRALYYEDGYKIKELERSLKNDLPQTTKKIRKTRKEK